MRGIIQRQGLPAPQLLEGRLLEQVSKLGTLNQKQRLRPEQICRALPAARPLQRDCSTQVAAGVTIIGLKLG